ncbi:MAG: hypothetical protein GYA23_02165 [Methanomicrobiales archaeon]|nr:hypothetical protein [Methanomicrobiales archaeon]
MPDDRGTLSIDFLVGFTIFMLAFIWVAAMIPGVLLGMQSSTIDTEAVAYRTGVILTEDPGWPSSPPWEFKSDLQKYDISRFGLALSKDTPNILSREKINRFFCSSFTPEDYHVRAIFGEIPYHMNISITELNAGIGNSTGEIIPMDYSYGYIRRLAMIKGSSNATLNRSYYAAHRFNYTKTGPDFNVTRHEFSILINTTKLQGQMKNPAYQINPTRDRIMVNLTDLRATIFPAPAATPVDPDDVRIRLSNVKIMKLENTIPPSLSTVIADYDKAYINGGSSCAPPACIVEDNVSLVMEPSVFDLMGGTYSTVYINLTFDMEDIAGNPVKSSFLNNSCSRPFDYNYNPANVTQPQLSEAIVEVAIW